MSKQPPTRTYCKRNRPLPYYHPNCRTPRHWKFVYQVEIDPSLCQNVSCMNPLYFFAVWDSKMAAVTKNSAEHENDNISITAK